MSMYGTCALCGEEIFERDHRESFKQLVGWAPTLGRRTGGLNELKAKQETGAVAHKRCVIDRNEKMKRGIPVQQKGLF